MKILPYILFFALGILFFSQDVEAQCAMCKAVAESGSKTDPNQSVATSGINSGILYIIAIPYILLASAIFYFFRKKIFTFARDLGIIS